MFLLQFLVLNLSLVGPAIGDYAVGSGLSLLDFAAYLKDTGTISWQALHNCRGNPKGRN